MPRAPVAASPPTLGWTSPPLGGFRYDALQADIAQVMAKDLFFIAAYPKSGTTWLQVMLDAHPEICCRGEGHFVDRLTPLLHRAAELYNGFIGQRNTTVFRELPPFPQFEDKHLFYLLASAMSLLLGKDEAARTARVIGEKTPDNLSCLPLLMTLFPRAKFLHVVRDGRDCAVSAWFHNQRANPQELVRRHGTLDRFVDHLAERWNLLVQLGLQFAAAHPDRCLLVRYEDLSLRPAETMQTVLGFLGVDTAAVAQCLAAGAFERMSGGRPRGVEDRESFMRLGVPGNWRDHLTEERNRAFLAVAGKALAQLGYQG